MKTLIFLAGMVLVCLPVKSQIIPPCIAVAMECSPGWQASDAKGICFIYSPSGSAGTAFLVNNSKNDGTPYLFTAAHVIDANANHNIEDAEITALANYKFRFYYFNGSCGTIGKGTWGPELTGAEYVTMPSRVWDDTKDIVLLKMKVNPAAPPYCWALGFAGCDFESNVPNNARIAGYGHGKPMTYAYTTTGTDNGSNWVFSSKNGQGGVWHGHSGSPVFDEGSHLGIGVLTGSIGDLVGKCYDAPSNMALAQTEIRTVSLKRHWTTFQPYLFPDYTTAKRKKIAPLTADNVLINGVAAAEYYRAALGNMTLSNVSISASGIFAAGKTLTITGSINISALSGQVVLAGGQVFGNNCLSWAEPQKTIPPAAPRTTGAAEETEIKVASNDVVVFPNPSPLLPVKIQYSVHRANTPVSAMVTDMQGKRVAILMKGNVQAAGRYTITWQVTGAETTVGAGVYLVVMQIGKEKIIKKVTIIR
jgi:hypothetical protein